MGRPLRRPARKLEITVQTFYLSFAKTPRDSGSRPRNKVTTFPQVIHFRPILSFGERHLLDHIIAVNESHLKRLLSEYLNYYHEDRTHLGLGKGTPSYRIRSRPSGRVLSHVRLGGLHHRYDRAA